MGLSWRDSRGGIERASGREGSSGTSTYVPEDRSFIGVGAGEAEPTQPLRATRPQASGEPMSVAVEPTAHAPDGPDSDSSFAHRLAVGASLANRSRLKRALDIIGALAGLFVLAPFLILVAIAIRLESPGPALFRQRRTGVGGVVFNIYKFRSMTVCEDGANLVQATQADARLTRLGAFLRRSCVDELPQLMNVLKGEMSLVGPRPHAVAHDTYYAAHIDGYLDRLMVRPGIAGLAQVSGLRGPTPTLDSMADRVALDRQYIADWSFATDLRILFRATTDGPFHPSAF